MDSHLLDQDLHHNHNCCDPNNKKELDEDFDKEKGQWFTQSPDGEWNAFCQHHNKSIEEEFLKGGESYTFADCLHNFKDMTYTLRSGDANKKIKMKRVFESQIARVDREIKDQILKNPNASELNVEDFINVEKLNTIRTLSKGFFQLLSGISCYNFYLVGANEKVMEDFIAVLPTMKMSSIFLKNCKVNGTIYSFSKAVKITNPLLIQFEENELEEGISDLTDVLADCNITDLFIINCKIGDVAAIKIIEVLPKSRIQFLELSKNPRITNKTADFLLSIIEKVHLKNFVAKETKIDEDKLKEVSQRIEDKNSKFLEDMPMRIGEQNYSNGDRYYGEMRGPAKHGKGIYYHTTGDYFEGTWKNDIRDGEGIHYMPNGMKLKVFFEKGDVMSKEFIP